MTARGFWLRLALTLATVAVPAQGETSPSEVTNVTRAYVYAIRKRIPPSATTPQPLEFARGNFFTSDGEVVRDEQGNEQLYNGCLITTRESRYTLRMQATWPGTAYFTSVAAVKPVEAKGACHLRVRRGTQTVAEFRTPFMWGVPCTAQGVFTARLPRNAYVCVEAWVSGSVGAMSQSIGNTVTVNGTEHSYPYPFAFLSFLEER